MPLKSGVYCIENIYNGKLYIGSSFNAHERLTKHFSLLRNGKSHNNHLQSSFNKYGEDAFIGYIIELCEKEVVKIREQFWIDNTSCLTGYNKSNIVTDNSGWNHTQEFKDMLSKQRIGNKNSQFGKKRTDEHKEYLKVINTGKRHTELSINKMINSRGKNKKNYIGSKSGKAILNEDKVYQIKTHLLNKVTHKIIAKMFNVAEPTISGIANNRRWSHVQLNNI